MVSEGSLRKKNIPVIVKQYTINDSLERIWSSILDINPIQWPFPVISESSAYT